MKNSTLIVKNLMNNESKIKIILHFYFIIELKLSGITENFQKKVVYKLEMHLFPLCTTS